MPVPSADDLLYGRFLILRRGKRTVGAVEVVGAIEWAVRADAAVARHPAA